MKNIYKLVLLAAMLAGTQAVSARGGDGYDDVATVGEGKFVTLSAAQTAVTDPMQMFTTQIPVGSNYKGTTFSVRIEYPEYSKLSREETMAVDSMGVALSDTIVPECNLTIEKKQGVLDVLFLPFVRRGGELYRLRSCKVAVYRKTSLLSRSVVAATRAVTDGRYAAHSVLAQGKWVKIRVSSEGVYQLTKSFLSSAGFSDPSKVKLYGYGGLPQDSVITYSGDNHDYDDLEEVPIYRDGNKLLFYANGTTKWYYKNSRWSHVNNPYSSYSYYFLTEGDSPASMTDAVTSATTSDTISTELAHALYEEDAFSWYPGGRQFYDSYDFANGNSRSYQVSTPDAVSGATATVTVVFTAANSLAATSVTSEINSTTLGTMNIPLLNRTQIGEQGNVARALGRRYSTTALAENNTVHFTTTEGHSARLDYILINYTRNLNLSSDYFELCDPANSGAGNYAISSANADTRVWRLGTAGRQQQNVPGNLSGTTLNVTLPEASDRYIVVNTGATFPTPTLEGLIENQDLHADSAYDMVIIIPKSGKLMTQAQRLADAHVAHDSLRVKILNAEDIYNEFSSGTPDAMAYRRYLKMLYDRATTSSDMPRYCLLFGDAAWDNRMTTSAWANYSPDDFLLCYESWNSTNEISCFVSDDFFTYLDDGEGKSMASEKPDIAVGRFPVRDESEAKVMVDKTINYMYNGSVGAWKNRIVVMGDDDTSSNSLMSDAETIASQIENNHGEYDVRRVYWGAYTVVKTSTGNSYPEITKELKSYMTNGALVMNYTGHGSPTSISHEKVLLLSDFKENKTNNPSLWVLSSCEITPFDGQEETIGETAVLNSSGGSVSFIGATRSVYSTRNLYLNIYLMRYLLEEQDNGRLMTMGEALMKAKCSLVTSSSGSTSGYTDYSINKMKYVLTGDPALSLAAPVDKVVVDSINGVAVSSGVINLAAGSVARVVGHVAKRTGESMSDFNGYVASTVYDKLEKITCSDNAGNGLSPYVFYARTRKLFEGNDSVVNGNFVIEFPVSIDASYSDDNCLLSLYAVNNERSVECHGANSSFAINTSAEIDNDSTGPQMFIYLNSEDFRDGDKTNTTPYFVALLSDSDGINATGSGVGHDLELIIDGKQSTTYVLNDYFQNNFGTYTSGSVGYSIPELDPGEHRLVFRAWDMLGNSSSQALNFVAVKNYKPYVIDVDCTPNPATETAVFNITYNRPATSMNFKIRVYDSLGQIVWQTTSSGYSDTGIYPVTWNLTNSDGARVGGGVYLYRVSVKEGNGASDSKTKKLIILNNK